MRKLKMCKKHNTRHNYITWGVTGCVLCMHEADVAMGKQVEKAIAEHNAALAPSTYFADDATDVHTRTAAVMFNISEDQVTPDMRRQAKSATFGLYYIPTASPIKRDDEQGT